MYTASSNFSLTCVTVSQFSPFTGTSGAFSFSGFTRFKDDVKEVQQGYECGVGIEKFNDIREGDTLEAYIMEEGARTKAKPRISDNKSF